MQTHTLSAIAVLAALSVPHRHSLLAQGFGPPVARWQNGFSRLGDPAEMPDGRVVIVDNLDGLIYLGPTGGGLAIPLGRKGEGPNEYQRPMTALHGQGDTILVFAMNRLVRVTPNGVIAGFHPFAPNVTGGWTAPPRGVDQAGNVYFDRPVLRTEGSRGIVRQQQIEIVRHRPGQTGVVVVAEVNDHAPEMHHNRMHPFAERDSWVVEPDGTLGILRARDYRVQWIRGGVVVRSGPDIPVRRMPISRADREAFLLEKANSPSGVGYGSRSGPVAGSPSPAMMAQVRELFPDESFPGHKPPFLERGALRSPAGGIWVIRSTDGPSATDSRIDVLDATGKRIRELTLPAGRRLVALERRGIYLVREDEDGLQYLERYAWPQGLR